MEPPVFTVVSRLASITPYLVGIALLYISFVAIHRLYFSPIAHVPGPKLAAVTSLYEFYHDCIHTGQFYFEIQKLLKIYGMVQHVLIAILFPV
jgi:hypothetical protein